MTETVFLSIAYIESKPDRAARTLESLNAEDAAELMVSVPLRIAAVAFGHMNPWSGARCIENMPPERAGGIIEHMPFLDAAALLRMASDANRSAILGNLPTKLARAIKTSLTFPRGTVGAHMDKLAPSLQATQTVADAIKFARQKRRPRGDIIFLTDAGRTYLGEVHISELLRHDGKALLAEIMETDIQAVLARSSLSAVESNPAWGRQSVLPVVGRKGNFLGALSRAEMDASLARHFSDEHHAGGNVLMKNMAVGYAVTVYGLLKMILHAAPACDQGESS